MFALLEKAVYHIFGENCAYRSELVFMLLAVRGAPNHRNILFAQANGMIYKR